MRQLPAAALALLLGGCLGDATLEVGQPCTESASCSTGLCQPGLVNGNPTGFLNGLCTAVCGSPMAPPCPPGSGCFPSPAGPRCFASCALPADCLPGYVCAPGGGCVPDCRNPGPGCGMRACKPNGLCG